MAKYPVYESTASLPGRSGQVRHSYDTRTGGEQVGRAIQGFGATVFDVGSTLFRRQGETELAEATAADADAIRQMYLRLDQNPDENTYQQEFDETWSTQIAGREVQNGWARRQRTEMLGRMRVAQQEYIDKAKAQRVEEKHKWAVANAEARAEQTGNVGVFAGLLAGEVADGRMTAEERDARLFDVRYKASQQRIAADAGNDPEGFLSRNPNPAALKKNYPDSKDTDYAWGHGLAQAAANDRKRRQEELTDQQLNSIYASARTQDINTVKQKIGQSDGLTEEQKVQAVKVAISASQLWEKDGVNPWENTQDYPRLANLIMGIESHSVKTKGDIDKIAFAGDKPNLSFSHWRMAHNLLDDYNKPATEGQYSRTHPMAATYFEMLKFKFSDDVNDKGVFEDPKKAQEYATKYGELEKAFQDPTIWRNTTKMQAAFDGITRPIDERKARSWLKDLFVGGAAKVGYHALYGSYGGEPAASAPAAPSTGEPASAEAFVTTVAQLKSTDPQAAKRYYDQWIAKFQ